MNLREVFPASDKPTDRILTGMLALVAFTLPFKFLVNGFIVVAFIVWLGGNPFKKLFSGSHFTKVLLAVLVFYFLHALGFVYTNNTQETWFSLEIKISLVIFPLIFYTTRYTWPQMKFLIMSFVLGNILLCLMCLVRSTFLYLGPKTDVDPFFYAGLSWLQHPSYLSMYLTFCCVVILQKNIFSKWLKLVIVIFFTGFVLLLSSKTGIAIHFLFLLLTGVSYFLKKGNYLKLSLFALVSLLVLTLIVSFVPPVKQRFLNVVGAFGSGREDKAATESTAVRMLIWKEARAVISEHPLLGVSPGDANDALYERYRLNGLTGAYEKKLNAHNQYLQTGVGLGLVGLASLCSLFAIPLFMRPRRLLVFFLLIIAVNFLTESMLQTMAGCIFFGYFYAVLSFDHQAAQRAARKNQSNKL
jgi:O-antigen ligase